jgi:hypothetical protein
MPQPSIGIARGIINERRKITARIIGNKRSIRILEPVVSALDRDKSDSRHGALYDCFTKYIHETRTIDIPIDIIETMRLTTMMSLVKVEGGID